jgi:ROS/MUCR transcriptional regulator protein
MSGLASGVVMGVARGAKRPLLANGALDQLAVLRADPRQAVQEDSIRCLVCGRVFRQLTNTHLRAHTISATEYKRRFGYNRGRPLMCRALRRLYVERAVRLGLAGRIRRRPILFEPELRRLGGCRDIALEEVLTRSEARRRPGGPSETAAESVPESSRVSDKLTPLAVVRAPAPAPQSAMG